MLLLLLLLLIMMIMICMYVVISCRCWIERVVLLQRSEAGQRTARQRRPHQTGRLRHVQRECLHRITGRHFLWYTRLHCARGKFLLLQIWKVSYVEKKFNRPVVTLLERKNEYYLMRYLSGVNFRKMSVSAKRHVKIELKGSQFTEEFSSC